MQQTGLAFSLEYSSPCTVFAVGFSFLRARGQRRSVPQRRNVRG